jgi:hypothetical protein
MISKEQQQAVDIIQKEDTRNLLISAVAGS